jgi:peptide/nickel transport system permease protein
MQQIIQFSNLNLVIKTPYLRESFQKSGKKVSETTHYQVQLY